MRSFYKSLKNKGLKAKPGFNFTGNSIFNGASFEVHKDTSPDDILALDQVKSIWPSHRIKAPRPNFSVQHDNDSMPSWTSHANTGVLDLHAKGYLGEGAVVGIVSFFITQMRKT